MNQEDREVEVKFYLSNPRLLLARLLALGAECTQGRLFEVNLRFDMPDGSLTRDQRVLRLRQDNRARMTYKGAAAPEEAVSVRQEIEFEVSDFEAARRLLEALGYQVSVMYEKWRTTYRLGDLEIVIDEMPFGNFCEIEGSEASSIQQAAASLGLDWDARIVASYVALFDLLKLKRQLKVNQLTFQELADLTVTPDELGVRPADQEAG
jgi:adenylate cyclase class 2